MTTVVPSTGVPIQDPFRKTPVNGPYEHTRARSTGNDCERSGHSGNLTPVAHGVKKMRHFLSSLFSPASSAPGGPDKALIEAATERAIDGTDPRLRAFLVSGEHLQEVLAASKP
jgi:hypothetical protein